MTDVSVGLQMDIKHGFRLPQDSIYSSSWPQMPRWIGCACCALLYLLQKVPLQASICVLSSVLPVNRVSTPNDRSAAKRQAAKRQEPRAKRRYASWPVFPPQSSPHTQTLTFLLLTFGRILVQACRECPNDASPKVRKYLLALDLFNV